MYNLIVSKNKKVTEEIARIIHGFYEEQVCLIADSVGEVGEMTDERQISLVFLEVRSDQDIEFAKKIIRKNPVANIIFLSDTKDFAYDAFEIHASGYLLLPVTGNKIIESLEHLRFQLDRSGEKRAEVHCFGKFEIFVGGKAVKFGRKKAKELLAYLVDRNGTMCKNDELLAALYEDREPTKSLKQQLRNVIYDLNKSLDRSGVQDIILRESDEIGIDREKIKCDYYDFQRGDPKALQSFRGEYMTQYSNWSYTMELNLQRYFYEE